METFADELTMSDTTILLTVEELINRAMGPPDANVVNFKLIKTIIEIMARQIRIMQLRIEVRSTELKEELMKRSKTGVFTESSLSKNPSLTGTLMAAKKRRENRQKYKTKASKETHSSDEAGTEDLFQSDEDQKSKHKRKIESKNDVLGGMAEHEEILEEIRKLDKHEVTKSEVHDRPEILEKQEIGDESGQSPELLKEEVVKNENSKERIEITEIQVDDEKILVLEKGPTIVLGARSSIDFITQSEFAKLEAEVEKLSKREVPKSLRLSEHQKLMNDIRKGAATLPEVTQALQIEERMKLAEESMTRILGLLTVLASVGALPEEIVQQVGTIIKPTNTLEKDEKHETLVEEKSVPKFSSTPRPFKGSKPYAAPTILKIPCVTSEKMSTELKNLKNDITKNLGNVLEKPTGMVEDALWIVKDVAEKMNVTQNLYDRITTLSTLVTQHNQRFIEFEASLTTLMENIEDQLAGFQRVVQSGLDKFVTANLNAEAEAVMKLTQRYADLEMKLHVMLHEHKGLTVRQTDLSNEMHTLLECIKRMLEEKSNRDEFREQLQYKADKSQLTGILRVPDFDEARVNFERRIEECHERFNRSVATWAAVVLDIKNTKEYKADFLELLATRELVEKQLRDIGNKISVASAMLGDPEIAVQSRKLALGAICGSCHEKARVEPYDVRKGAPPRLPAIGKLPVEAAKEQLIPDWVRAGQPLHRLCRRWCGGSHTTVQDSSKRMQLKIHLQALPIRKFADYGDDGRLYMMAEELKPCIECNTLDGEKRQDHEPVYSHIGSEKCTCPLAPWSNKSFRLSFDLRPTSFS